jgi:hypothetical protein
MARHSSDREDLMAEAVALTPRVAFELPGSANEIVAGRRANGWWSIYLGGDPAYHFDAQHRLRRAFIDGYLYRSQGSTLARLSRENRADETNLVRHDLTPAELSALLQQLRQNLQEIAAGFAERGERNVIGVPEDTEYLVELAANLHNVLSQDIVLSPAVGRR